MLTKRCYVYFLVVLHSLSSSFLDLALQLLCAYKPSLSHETKCVFIPFPLPPQMKFLHALSTSSHIDLGRSVVCITYEGKAYKTDLVRVTHPAKDKDFAFQALNRWWTLSIINWKVCFVGLLWKTCTPRYLPTSLVHCIPNSSLMWLVNSPLTLWEIHPWFL